MLRSQFGGKHAPDDTHLDELVICGQILMPRQDGSQVFVGSDTGAEQGGKAKQHTGDQH